MFKDKQKLVCVNNGKMWHDVGCPAKGEIVTFNGMNPNPQFPDFIYLKEYMIVVPSTGKVTSFRATCFRPVDETFGEETATRIESELEKELQPETV